MTRWDIKETRRLIEYHHGREQLARARPCLRSMNERPRHARYHLQEIKKILKTHMDDRLEKDDIFKLMFPLEMEGWDELNNWLMEAEAHMIACAQSIHSIPDILAHVIHFALGFNLGVKAPKDREINVRKVTASLAKHAPAYVTIEHILRALKDNPSFVELNAIVNHIKHRGAVEPRLSLLPSDYAAPYAMEFGTIAYGEVTYPGRELEAVLAPSYEAASHAIVATGNAINEVLSR